MRVPFAWLAKDSRFYSQSTESLDIEGIGVDRVARSLTMAGLEVEEIVESEIGPVLITKVTPNRGDWLSVHGVERELNAALAAELRPRNSHKSYASGWFFQGHKEPLPVPIRIDVPDWCPRYTAAIVDLNAPLDEAKPPSPEVAAHRPTTQDYLKAAGVRPVNAVVDTTNFVMLDRGQPLHAFDLDKISGPEIIVRAAREGESIVTLDGIDRALDPSIMVIADAEKPIAIAGIMGGRDTEITGSTRRVLLESAYFNPAIIRLASKKLNLVTDASYRYERYVDPSANVTLSIMQAIRLIGRETGGRMLAGAFDSAPLGEYADHSSFTSKLYERSVTVRDQRASDILGISVEQVRSVDNSLRVLGFSLSHEENGVREFRIPTWRNDIHREIDIVEEIGRMIGYDKLPETLPPARSSHGGGHDSPEGLLTDKVRSILIGQALTEVYSHTLSAPSDFDNPAATGNRVKIRSALSAELSGLRQSLAPGLLETLARNARLRNTGVDLFEVGSVFWTAAGEGYSQGLRAAVAVQGDYKRARGIAENLFAALGVPFPDVTAHVHPGMHPSRSARLTLGEQEVGFIAEADPDMMAEHLDLPAAFGRVGCFEIDLDRVTAHASGPASYFPLPKYPEVARDLAMVFDADAPYGTIERVAKLAAGEYLESVSLVSIYTGERIEAGRKSVALRFTLRAQDRTLTDADADTALLAAQTALAENLGGTLR